MTPDERARAVEQARIKICRSLAFLTREEVRVMLARLAAWNESKTRGGEP